MKALKEGITVKRHLDSGTSQKLCLRDASTDDKPHTGVEWDGGCCSKGRTGFSWEELREVFVKTLHSSAMIVPCSAPVG